MFVEARALVLLPFEAARHALESSLVDGGLVRESRRAADEGATFLMRVGPGRGRGLTKQVEVQMLPARGTAGHVAIPLRWQPTGMARRLFPSLDADLDLATGGQDCCTLSIVACYRPPLDAISNGLDRAVMSRIAKKTLDVLLDEISATISAEDARKRAQPA